MAHPGHPDDTLFLLAEPDFRFYKDEAESQRHEFEKQEAVASLYETWSELHDSLPVDQRGAFRRDLERWVAAQAQDQNAPWPIDAEANPTECDKGNSQHEPWDAQQINWGDRVSMVYTRSQKPPVTAFTPDRISEELHDLHALFTAASRLGRGGFLWAGWSASQWSAGNKQTRKRSPASGAHLSLMTTECARKLLPMWLKCRDTHMGYFFGHKLGLEWQEYLGSSYVWPPIGGFWEHTSTTCSTPLKPVNLKHHFDDEWAQEGTRKRRPDQQDRSIMSFTPSGPPKFLSKPVQLPQDLPLLVWRTQPPPGTPDFMCGIRYYHQGISTANKPPHEDRWCEKLLFAFVRVEPLATLTLHYRKDSFGCLQQKL